MQFADAIDVINGDKSNPTNVYLHNATAKPWTTQTEPTGSFDPLKASLILDSDISLFCAYFQLADPIAPKSQ
jgi:hypothetical protein